MKSNYYEKKENRIAAYKNLAARHQELSATGWAHARNMTSCIPMGQPILIGHHSERGHRALLQRADNTMRAAHQAGQKADYYTDKAASAESNNAISSDDPDALEALRAKLAKLEKKQEFMKAVNKVCAKANALELLQAMGVSESSAQILLNPKYSYEKKGFQSYQLTNNNATINTTKKRIAVLEKMQTLTDQEINIGSVRIVGNVTENRTQIFFPDKPRDECRKELKSYGFKWAPSVGAWMRYYSNQANQYAKAIATKYYNN